MMPRTRSTCLAVALALGTAPAAVAQPAWLDYVNNYRRSAGLPVLTENATWSDGDRKHAIYTVKNDTLGHTENPSLPFYTPEGHTAAQNSNVMAGSSTGYTDESAIDLWMNGPFHAVGIIDPRLAVTGFGSDRESGGSFGMAAALDVLRGRSGSTAGVTFPIAWPGHGQRVPVGSYGGSEYPNPLTSCPGYTAPSGLPIIMQFGTGSVTPIVSASSFREGTTALEHCVFTEQTYTNTADTGGQSLGRSVLNSRDAVVLIPRAPLQTGHTYTASLTVNGVTRTWSFGIGAFGAIPPPDDTDGDGLPDAWEALVGLRIDVATGPDGATGDPDADGRTNAQEYVDGTHPNGCASCVRYFAEGATSTFFDMRVALLNPSTSPAHAWVRFLKTDGSVVTTGLVVGARSRATLDPASVSGMSQAEFSTMVESDLPLVADRTMTWDASGYGAHAETAISAPSTRWFLAEGATHSGLELFYLFQNPSLTQASTVRVRYLLPSGAPLERTYTIAPNSRQNIWVDEERWNGAALLANTDVSAVIEVTNNVPLIVERAMYRNVGAQVFGAGHEAAGVTDPALSWFLAEGATGPMFDLFVLVANPDATRTATVEATFLVDDGTTFTKQYSIAPSSRYTIWVDRETFVGVTGVPLDNVAVSTTVASQNGVPIIVERAMWWPGPEASSWSEAHATAGATTTGVEWALADGEVGGAGDQDTYVLIANTSNFAGSARVTLLFDDGTSSQATVPIPARSRTTVDARAFFPQSFGRRFGTIVESLGATPAQIVVERAMYGDAGGVAWAAGTAVLGQRLR